MHSFKLAALYIHLMYKNTDRLGISDIIKTNDDYNKV